MGITFLFSSEADSSYWSVLYWSDGLNWLKRIKNLYSEQKIVESNKLEILRSQRFIKNRSKYV